MFVQLLRRTPTGLEPVSQKPSQRIITMTQIADG
jgi:hypothetical protein